MRRIITTLFFCLLFSASESQQTVGLFAEEPASLDGYVLFAPIYSDTTYLIDKCGRKIHEWSSNAVPGLSVYLLPNGTLLRTEAVPNSVFTTGSTGGRLAEYDWNSNLLWSYTISSDTETQDHDACPLPNGNVIAVIWEYISAATAVASGRNSFLLGTAIWSAKLEELQPVGADSAIIVWQWRAWDHLIQDFDSTKPYYGVVADHPELINLNYYGINGNRSPDWLHMNGIDYDSALDQVLFSFRTFSEVYIIDHSTTTAEAASHSGGRYGKGGDFLYRWGNPVAYNRGTAADRKFYTQHNPTWIPSGYPGAGEIMVFDNGLGRPGGNASSADVIIPPVDSAGNYSIDSSLAFGPATIDWSYMTPVPADFYSVVMGSAQRLPNGNTLICAATTGRFFEVVDTAQDSVWDYVNPVDATGPVAQYTVPTSNNSFRCVYYSPSYSGLAGQTLTPGSPIELNPIPNSCGSVTTTHENISTQNSSFIISNPFTNSISIHSTTGLKNAKLRLMDVTGRVIQEWSPVTTTEGELLELPLNSSLNEGIYLFNIRDENVNFSAKLVHL